MNPYLDALNKRLLPRIKEINADGKVTMRELWDSKDEVFEAVTSIMAEAATFDHNDKVYVIDAFSQLFDGYVKPVNIPWIPDFMEAYLKDSLRGVMIALITKHIDKQIAKGTVVGSARPPQ